MKLIVYGILRILFLTLIIFRLGHNTRSSKLTLGQTKLVNGVVDGVSKED